MQLCFLNQNLPERKWRTHEDNYSTAESEKNNLPGKHTDFWQYKSGSLHYARQLFQEETAYVWDGLI